MKTFHSPNLKAHLTLDENQKVRHIRHSQEYWPSEQDIPSLSANDYLMEMADTLQIPKEEFKNLHKKVSFLDPREQGIEYHLSEEKEWQRPSCRLLSSLCLRTGRSFASA